MGFLQFFRAIDELLYEVMSWLVFYPITLWRAIRHPLHMMEYSDIELKDSEDEQFTDTLSPPLFLLISLLISHALELVFVGNDPIIKDHRGLANFIDDDTSLLAFRLATFSIFPLIMALRLVRRLDIPLTRETLKPPFYSQCYVAAPFALALGLANILVESNHRWVAGLSVLIIVLTLLWFGALQSLWFAQHLGSSRTRGFLGASAGMVECLVILAVVTSIVY